MTSSSISQSYSESFAGNAENYFSWDFPSTITPQEPDSQIYNIAPAIISSRPEANRVRVSYDQYTDFYPQPLHIPPGKSPLIHFNNIALPSVLSQEMPEANLDRGSCKRSKVSSKTPKEDNTTKKKKRKFTRTPSIKEILICLYCGTQETPLWRRGPEGKHTLCNADGIQYEKERKLNSIVSNGKLILDPHSVEQADHMFRNGPWKKEQQKLVSQLLESTAREKEIEEEW